MSRMTLGGYTFPIDPKEPETLNKVKKASYQETLTSVAYFSYGASIEGKLVPLEWEYMPKAMFEQLDAFNVADNSLVWNPQTGNTYNVKIFSLTGKYFGQIDDADSYGRQSIKMELLILSEV